MEIFGSTTTRETVNIRQQKLRVRCISKFLPNTDLQINFLAPAAVDLDRKLNMFYGIRTID